MTHWIITLYERYAQLYGDPIEQPVTPARATGTPKPGEEEDSSPTSR